MQGGPAAGIRGAVRCAGMRVLSVSEFLSGVNDVLAGVPALVEGEISGYSVSQGKWAFFSLKDDASVVGCFMPVWKIRHVIEDGMAVRVAGVPRVYEKSGKFSIVVEALEPSGEGSLKRAFELLKQKLEREGLFAAERKRALPRFPETIGLIASAESAAYSDFLRILRNRWGNVRVLLADVPVQGDGAVEAIVRALWWFGGTAQHAISNLKSQIQHQQPELLVLTRGGGSLEDLQAFNSEDVARAIFASPIPVVVGVGHERDVTIADLVADVRASTPSNAAERVVPDRRDVTHEVAAMVEHSGMRIAMMLRERRTAMDRFLLRGGAFAHARRSRVDAQAAALAVRIRGLAETCAASLATAERLMAGLNPERLLSRGYSMTTVHGRIVRDVASLAPGDTIETRFARGSATATVDGVSPVAW